MTKHISNFEEFAKVNEEISDDYLTGKIDKAKESGRQISPGYETELYKKKGLLNDADRSREIENKKQAEENKFRKMQEVADEVASSLKGKTFNIDGLQFKVTGTRVAGGPSMEIHLQPTETNRIDRIVITYEQKPDDIKAYIYVETEPGKKFPIARLSEIFGTLTQVFRKYLPESKFVDRKIWSALESHMVKFDDFDNVNEAKSLEDELEAELAWVRKYSKYVDKGSYPKDDYDDEDEFYADLEKTENNIERLKKKLKSKKSSVNELFGARRDTKTKSNLDNIKKISNKQKEEILCPDCEEPVKFEHEMNTDRHGNLKYYTCKNCKERFVSQDGGELDIAAK